MATLRWLRERGVDRRLADKYVRSGWLARLGHGAYTRAGDSVDWPGALRALQEQLQLPVHPGAMTAFELRGYAHDLALGDRRVVLFGAQGTRLPRWFAKHGWSRPVMLVTSRVLPDTAASTSAVEHAGVELSVATLEQAAFELFYLVPERFPYEAALQVMESLTALRPAVVQRLLEGCTSVKTKRLFMHAAERLDHTWLSHVGLAEVDFGTGRRTIHPGGTFDQKYDLVVAEPEPE